MENYAEMTITDRWFIAFDELLLTGRLSRNGICRELNIDCRNFEKQRADHSRRIIRLEWLSHLVLKYGVSADWLLTGRGWPWGE